MNIKKKLCFLIIFLFTIFIMITSGKEVKAASERKTYDISKGDVVIKKSGDYNLVGSTHKHKLIIKSSTKVNLWIQDLSIESGGYYDGFSAPITVEKGATLNLTVLGHNTITNTDYGDAITVTKGGNLAISKNSSGTLTVNGSVLGSGIGGQGSVSINGGIITANGGSYGAGIGNSQAPNSMTLKINGGTVTAQGGFTSKPAKSSELNYYKDNYKSPSVYDVSAASFVISGGNIHVNSSYKNPVNSSGKVLYRYLFNCEKGKVSSITVDGKNYGAQQITSNGYLSLWGERYKEIKVKFTNGKETKIQHTYGLVSDDMGNGMTLDLSASSVDFYEDGFIYKNHIYRIGYGLGVKIIGASDKNYIRVHEGKHIIDFVDVKIDYSKQKQSFVTIGNRAHVTINFSGVNQITTNQDNHAFLLGYQATLSFTAEDTSNVMKLINTNGFGSIITATGTINQYGGSLVTESQAAGYGIVVGDSGTYNLYGGRYQGSSKERQSIYGFCQMKVNIHGGELIADTIGYRDEENSEISDKSTFTVTGGNVSISQRLIFGNVMIYGGQIKAHLLGSGSGTQFYQFAGDLVMDKFITDLTNFPIEPPYYYVIDGSVNEKSALDMDRVYGGSIHESNEVSVEELQKISIGSC